MLVKAIWEFDIDADDLSEEFVDVKGLAKDLTKTEMENLLQNQEISAEDFSYEVETDKQFTDEELYVLSDGVLALIKNTNQALQLTSDKSCIEALEKLNKKYKELNMKICGMLK